MSAWKRGRAKEPDSPGAARLYRKRSPLRTPTGGGRASSGRGGRGARGGRRRADGEPDFGFPGAGAGNQGGIPDVGAAVAGAALPMLSVVVFFVQRLSQAVRSRSASKFRFLENYFKRMVSRLLCAACGSWCAARGVRLAVRGACARCGWRLHYPHCCKRAVDGPCMTSW